jgi:hypothetical protein
MSIAFSKTELPIKRFSLSPLVPGSCFQAREAFFRILSRGGRRNRRSSRPRGRRDVCPSCAQTKILCMNEVREPGRDLCADPEGMCATFPSIASSQIHSGELRAHAACDMPFGSAHGVRSCPRFSDPRTIFMRAHGASTLDGRPCFCKRAWGDHMTPMGAYAVHTPICAQKYHVRNRPQGAPLQMILARKQA